MLILAIEHEKATRADAVPDALLRDEARRVWELYQSGIVRSIHFRADRPAAVLTLECRSEAEADALLKTLPLVEKGMISFEIIPLKPYPGFARLFAR